jgi:hypothetical protein
MGAQPNSSVESLFGSQQQPIMVDLLQELRKSKVSPPLHASYNHYSVNSIIILIIIIIAGRSGMGEAQTGRDYNASEQEGP